MSTILRVISSLFYLFLVACSSQEVKQEPLNNNASQDTAAIVAKKNQPFNEQSPPMTLMKNGKTLNLVRIMDGGICKNEFQGAKGVFLLYVDPNDIKRIKEQKGAAIFSTFETDIQKISGDALHAAIDQMNLSEDPFSLGEDEARQKLAQKLMYQFRNASTDIIASFEKKTSLTIDITAFPPSLEFYQKGCDATTIDTVSTDKVS
jgi:hypothetical protein